MKKFKRVISLVLMTCLFLSLAGCGKKAITADEFVKKAEDKGYYVVDCMDQFTDIDYVKAVKVAAWMVNEEVAYKVEFYVLDNDSNAAGFFANNKEIFKDYKTSGSTEASTTVGSTKTYSLTTSDSFGMLVQVDNTVFYAFVDKQYKDDVKDFAKAIGY